MVVYEVPQKNRPKVVKYAVISYSIAIRTLGRAGAKYQKLLDSIRNSTVQPEKVVVVLPEGYSKPSNLGMRYLSIAARVWLGSGWRP